jgi:hypothetical protein
MELTALIVSMLAVLTSIFLGLRALMLARHSNTMPVLIDLFREHRSIRFAEGRRFAYKDLAKHDLSQGLPGLPEEKQELIRDLVYFYDNLGALVAHGIVDIAPISGYLGGSVVMVWEKVRPLVEAERNRRSNSEIPARWQMYFENLYCLVLENPPEEAREAQGLWRLNASMQHTVRLPAKSGTWPFIRARRYRGRSA